MYLNRAGREFIRWPFSTDYDPTGNDVEVHLNGEWHNVEAGFVVTGSGPYTGEVSLLVAGPDATGNPGGTVVLPVGNHTAFLRFPDFAESIIREGGSITVTEF